jgi:hypothetical protein
MRPRAWHPVLLSKHIGEAMTQKQDNQTRPSGPSKEAYQNMNEEQRRQEQNRKSSADASEDTDSSQNSQPGSGSGS